MERKWRETADSKKLELNLKMLQEEYIHSALEIEELERKLAKLRAKHKDVRERSEVVGTQVLKKKADLSSTLSSATISRESVLFGVEAEHTHRLECSQVLQNLCWEAPNESQSQSFYQSRPQTTEQPTGADQKSDSGESPSSLQSVTTCSSSEHIESLENSFSDSPHILRSNESRLQSSQVGGERGGGSAICRNGPNEPKGRKSSVQEMKKPFNIRHRALSLPHPATPPSQPKVQVTRFSIPGSDQDSSPLSMSPDEPEEFVCSPVKVLFLQSSPSPRSPSSTSPLSVSTSPISITPTSLPHASRSSRSPPSSTSPSTSTSLSSSISPTPTLPPNPKTIKYPNSPLSLSSSEQTSNSKKMLVRQSKHKSHTSKTSSFKNPVGRVRKNSSESPYGLGPRASTPTFPSRANLGLLGALAAATQTTEKDSGTRSRRRKVRNVPDSVTAPLSLGDSPHTPQRFEFSQKEKQVTCGEGGEGKGKGGDEGGEEKGEGKMESEESKKKEKRPKYNTISRGRSLVNLHVKKDLLSSSQNDPQTLELPDPKGFLSRLTPKNKALNFRTASHSNINLLKARLEEASELSDSMDAAPPLSFIHLIPPPPPQLPIEFCEVGELESCSEMAKMNLDQLISLYYREKRCQDILEKHTKSLSDFVFAVERDRNMIVQENESLLEMIGKLLSNSLDHNNALLMAETLEGSCILHNVVAECRQFFSSDLESIDAHVDFIACHERLEFINSNGTSLLKRPCDLTDTIVSLTNVFDSLSLGWDVREHFCLNSLSPHMYLLNFVNKFVGDESGLARVMRTVTLKIQRSVIQQITRNVENEFSFEVDDHDWHVCIKTEFPKGVRVTHRHKGILSHKVFGDLIFPFRIQLTLDPALLVITDVSTLMDHEHAMFDECSLATEEQESLIRLTSQLLMLSLTRAQKRKLMGNIAKLKPR